MPPRRTLAALALSAALALLLALPSCRWRRGSEVVLGEVAALTGDRSRWGEDLHRGIALAVAQANARGGLNGRRLRLVTLDDESRDERAGTLAARLIEREGPVALFGEPSSAACNRAAQAAQRRSVPFVSPGSAARDVTHVGDFVFRTALTDAEQAQALAHHVRQALQRRRAAVVYPRSSILHLRIADAFAEAFRRDGGEVVLRDSYSDDTDLVRLTGRIRASGAEVVYAPSGAADAGRIAVAARQGRVGAMLLGSDGWSSPEVRRYAQDAVVGALFTDAFSANVPRPEVDAFVEAFRDRYHASPGTFAALGFDAARWVIQRAARAPLLDARTLRDALLGSRMENALAGTPLSVDARRALVRPVYVLRYESDGVGVAATVNP